MARSSVVLHPTSTGGHVASQADVIVALVGFTGYLLCFGAYLYVWRCRYFPPLRVKNLGLTIVANFAAFIWFLSLMITKHLESLWRPSPSTAWAWQLFGQFLGLSVYLTSLLAKQYRAFQHYTVGKATYSSLTHVMLGQIPVVVLMAIPVKLYVEEAYNLMDQDLADYIGWAYEGLMSTLCFIMMLNLRAANTCYHYPNYRDSSLECIGLLVQTFFHAYVLMSPAFGERTKQLLIVLGNTVVIPIALFFGVLGRPMWKCCSRETELACPFDPCFESRTSRFAGIHPLIGYSSPPRLQSPLRADYRRDTSSPSFEVEELSKLVMAGELRQVKHLLYNATLGIINEKDSEGSTPLHRAVRNMHKEMIEFLLNMGADVDVAEADGVTALHVAASLGNVDCIYLLAGVSKANVNAMTQTHGKTPLDIAVKSECMATICTLLNLGADPNRCAPADSQEPLLDIRPYIRKVGHYSKHKSPFFLAVELGLDRIINFMHSIYTPHGGVALEAPEPQGMTPLCVASLLGHTAVMESLLRMRADPFNINQIQRRSALHYVCMKGSLKGFQILLKALSCQLPRPQAKPQGQYSRKGSSTRSSWDCSWRGDGDDEDAITLLRPTTSGTRSSFDNSMGHSESNNSASGLEWRLRTGSTDTSASTQSNGGGYLGTLGGLDGGRKGMCPDTATLGLRSTATPGGKRRSLDVPGSTAEWHVERLPQSWFNFLNLQDLHGRTALHYAALKGSAQITYMLLCLGAHRGLEDTRPPVASSPSRLPPGRGALSPPVMGNPDAPPKGLSARRYAELAQGHDPSGKVLAAFEEAERLLQRAPDYPHQYLHDDAKWLPVS